MSDRLFSITNKIAVIAGLATLALLIPILQRGILAWEQFMPHATCYRNDPDLIMLHVLADSFIGLAYLSISLTLAHLVRRARVPFHWVFVAFGAFIFACGITHIMEVVTVYRPIYWFSGAVKVVTAVASVITALVLFPLHPRAVALAHAAEVAEERRVKLESAHAELQTLYERVKHLDQLKTQFFANVSHELRMPLALIMGPVQLLSRAENLTPAQRQELEVVARNARLLLRNVNDLLDIAKLDAGKMGPSYSGFDLTPFVRMTCSYFESLATERRMVLQVRAPESLPIQADAEKTQRVLLNLLSNAFKFTPPGGQIIVELTADAARARLSVQDSGPGVDPAQRETIFERFEQGTEGVGRRGTGLGLAIVREFVQLQDGRVWVGASRLGGADFVVELPLRAPATMPVRNETEVLPGNEELSGQVAEELRTVPRAGLATETPPEATLAGPPAPTATVLVVEDDPDMQNFTRRVLAPQFNVLVANNGAEGLEMARRHRPEVVLADVMMPVLDGLEMLKQMRQEPELADLPVIFVSAKADEEMRVELLRHGAHDHLVKPFIVEELRARVGNLATLERTRRMLQHELANRAGNLETLTRDVLTRTRDLEVARREAEAANRLKDEFLATLSHELRTPLTAMLGWSRLLRTGKLDEAGSQRAVETIERNARVQAQLIEDLLDVSRIITGKLAIERQIVELAPIIEAAVLAVRPAAEAKQLQVVVEHTGQPAVVQADPNRLQQIIWNLLSNAIKFTPKNGRIEVHAARVGSRVEIRVADTGRGIPPEFLPHVFDRFRQADSSSTRAVGGLGLGLAIVRHLTELHGGEVRAESAGEGKGATFTVSLPLTVVKPAPAQATDEMPIVKGELSGTRVLVVDDEADARELLQTVLQQAGAEVLLAGGVSEALRVLQEQQPQLLVSDIGMPEQDGYALIRQVRKLPDERLKTLPALALTAYAHEEAKTRVLAAGFNAHMAKPIEPGKFVQALTRLLKRE